MSRVQSGLRRRDQRRTKKDLHPKRIRASCKKIFPALQAMVAHGQLNVPVIGVAKAGWDLDQLRARAYESVVKYGPIDHSAFDKLARLLRYVDGDYNDPATF